MGEKPVRTSEWGRICSCNCTARAWVHSEPLSWVLCTEVMIHVWTHEEPDVFELRQLNNPSDCKRPAGAGHPWLDGGHQQWSSFFQTEMYTHGCLSRLVWVILGAHACKCACSIAWIQILLMTRSLLWSNRLLNYLISSKTQTVAYFWSFSGVTALLELHCC